MSCISAGLFTKMTSRSIREGVQAALNVTKTVFGMNRDVFREQPLLSYVTIGFMIS